MKIAPGISRILLVVLVLIAPSFRVAAAISEGKKPANPAEAEQKRNSEFYRAQQSLAEKLKVGKERYAQKEAARAKVVAAMSAELQARQQVVVIPPSVTNLDTPVDAPPSGPSGIVIVSAFAVIAFGFFLWRIVRNARAPMPRAKRPAYL